MQLWTLTRTSGCCGDTVVLGVFENMEAATFRLNHIATYADPGDELHVELFQLATEEEERKRWGTKMNKSTTTEDN